MSTLQTKDDLVTAVVAAFRLTEQQIEEMARAIYDGRVSTYSARYHAAADTLKVTLPTDWQPSEAVLKKMAKDALASAKGIAATYHANLEAEARQLAAEEKALHKAGTLAAGLANWAHERAGRKSEQIANYETSQSGSDASDEFYDDLMGGDLSAGVDLEAVVILVLPFSAREPFCQEYAGNVYSLLDYPDLAGTFPAHGGCPHFFLFVPYFQTDAATAPDEEEEE